MKEMVAETERLILRRYESRDFDDLYEYLSDPEVVEFEPYKAQTAEETRENLLWRISSEAMIAVELKENGKMIGNVYLGDGDFGSKELGYVFNKKFWHKGYAKEACEAVIEKCFRDGIHRIIAYCDQKNPASFRLLERLGFRREGDFRQNVYFWKDENGNPIWKDSFEYALLNGEK